MNELDNLYSRQITSIGIDANNKFNNLNIMVLGLDILGIEICKCLTLMGIQNLYIYDPRKFNADQNLIFCKVNKKEFLDITISKYLQTLNKNVIIYTIRNENINDLKLDTIIQTELTVSLPKTELNALEINSVCRKNNIKYILGITIGLTGYIFTDLIKHTVTDFNGEKYKMAHIENIEIDIINNQSILVMSETKDKFSTGDIFKFINKDNSPCEDTNVNYTIINIIKNSIIINDIIDASIIKNQTNIQILEVKEEIVMNYNKLEDCLDTLPINHLNLQDKNIHTIKQDLKKYILNCKLYNNTEYTFDFILNNYKFPIISSIIGAVISQEIVKLTGKFTPLHQEFLVDYSELYINDLYKTKKKTYENVYGLLSKDLIKYITKLNIFMVGCGALGCEYLKLFAFLNCSSVDKSNIFITDMDNIELSNLNRQFLFNESDIGKSKSITAHTKIKQMVPTINIRSYTEKLDKHSEPKFNKLFWNNIDITVNALDNVEARQYVDNQCIIYEKPLFESGTLGTKCNIQIIVPHETASYSDTLDPIDDKIALCTVKYFPYKIEHCIEWSLEIFHNYFNEFLIIINKFLESKELFQSYINTIDNENIVFNIVQELTYISPFLENPTSKNMDTFIKFIYIKLFIIPTHNLIKSFPKDFKKDGENYFWIGTKIYPKLIDNIQLLFDEFIQSFGTLFSECLNFKYSTSDIIIDKNELNSIINDSGDNLVIVNNIVKNQTNLKSKITSLLDNLYNLHHTIKPEIKTQLLNDQCDSHIKFVHIISNIRATIYSIPIIDFLQCKLIACKITPALSSTTTLITAVNIMEILKHSYNTVYKNKFNISKQLINYDSFINTGINLYIQSLPQKSKKFLSGEYNNLFGSTIITAPGDYITPWDKFIIPKNVINIRDLIKYIERKCKIKISMLTINNNILYNNTSKLHNFTLTLIEIYQKFNIPSENFLIFEVFAYNKNIPIILPKIYYSRIK